MSKVNYLINYLLSERDDLGRMEIPATEQDKFRLYRSLVNIRPAVKADEDFLLAEDEYLTALTESKGITDTSDLTPVEDGIYLWKGRAFKTSRSIPASLSYFITKSTIPLLPELVAVASKALFSNSELV